jgi:ribose-phosphate pyrophosphokinase
MVDDMITSGGTITKAATLLKAVGALDIYVAATHAVMCENAVTRISQSPIKSVAVTDTIPLCDEARTLKNLTQLSLAPLLGEAIKRIHLHQSISELFLRKSRSRS